MAASSSVNIPTGPPISTNPPIQTGASADVSIGTIVDWPEEDTDTVTERLIKIFNAYGWWLMSKEAYNGTHNVEGNLDMNTQSITFETTENRRILNSHTVPTK